MAGYYLGIDTGATKTHALIANAEGHVLAFEQGGPGNPQSIGGYRALAGMLTELVQRACASAGIAVNSLTAAGLGLAGYDWPSQRQRFFDLARAAGLPEQTAMVNDAGLGIYAGTSAGWGVCLAAGTSFNCRALAPDGREGRAIGDGLQWDEGAGALELVQRAAQRVIAHWLHTGPASALTGLLMAEFGAPSQAALVEGLVLRRYPVDASLAPKVLEVARAGDPVASEVVLWAAGKLADLALGAARQLDLQDQSFELVLSGSFFNAGAILIDPLKEKVLAAAPHARFRRLEIPPVCGGVLLAMVQVEQLSIERRAVLQTVFKGRLG